MIFSLHFHSVVWVESEERERERDLYYILYIYIEGGESGWEESQKEATPQGRRGGRLDHHPAPAGASLGFPRHSLPSPPTMLLPPHPPHLVQTPTLTLVLSAQVHLEGRARVGAVPLPSPSPWTLHFPPGWELKDPLPGLVAVWDLGVPVQGGLPSDIPVRP